MVKHRNFRILLVAPYKNSFLGMAKFPPLGLGYLATSLKRQGYTVKILDCLQAQIDSSKYRRYLLEEEPDVVGINSWSCSVNEVKEMLEITKAVDRKITTVVGGPHPSAVPYEAMSYFTGADFGFKGEAEIGLPMLVDGLINKKEPYLSKVPGLLWRERGQLIVNQQIFYERLDDFGILSWDLVRPAEYAQKGTIVSGDTAPIITSRGCPYLCTFCSPHIVSGRKIRLRSPGHIIKEIKLLKEEYGIKRIAIMDENFTFSKEHTAAVCHKIIQEKIKMRFFLPNGVRLNTLDKELLSLMKKAGFLANIAVGIESGSERVLKLIKKGLNKEMIKTKVRLLRQSGFRPIGYFILGFPTETKKEMYETLKFAKELKLYRAAFSPLLILPGTEIYEYLKKNAELPTNYSFSSLVTDSVTYAPSGITLKEFSNIRKDIVFKFNLQFRVLLDYMRDWNSFVFAAVKFFSIFLRRKKVENAFN
ncbi:MAG: B12-binding domain-containing radical SAM protein [Candidatus Omnitrophota bacterium]|nr:MAG: B12-binding domain-containing radical SAM protein [Candidatus Omnitrophota bacterium]